MTLHKNINGASVPVSQEQELILSQTWDAYENTLMERETKRYASEIQKRLDSQANSMGYDSIFTAVTYADEPSVPAFQADGQALRAWRSSVWAYAYQVLGDVEAGNISLPTLEEFLAGLPAFN